MLRWVCVVVLAIGCGGRARVHAPGEVWLSSIRITGNKSIPADDLIPGLALDRVRRDGQRVDPYQLGLDTKRIRGAYLRMGFFEAKVDSRIERQGDAEIVRFVVDEGPRSKARVSVTGLPPELPEEAVLGKLELKEGAPFDYELYDDGKEIVRAMVEEAGYPHFDLDGSAVTVDRETRVAAASYHVERWGPRAFFGQVTVIGLAEFPDLERAILGRLQFREGELYSPRAIADTQRSLYDLGRFAQVRVDPDKSARTAIVPITIAVSVAGRHEVKGGGGLGYEPSTYEARLRGGFSYVPDEHPLLSFGFDGRLALSVDHGLEDFEPRLRLFFNVQRLELFRPYVIGDVGAGLEYFTLESYTARGPIVRTGLSAPLGKRWLTAQLGWNFSYFEFLDVSPFIGERDQELLGLRDNERNGRFEQSIAADLRDKPLEPRKGAYFSLRVIEGGAFAGGAFNYLEIQPDLRGYLPIGRLSSLAFRFRGGAFLGSDRVPMSQRYFSGGAQNHRGFTARGLTPTIVGSIPAPTLGDPGGVAFGRAPIGGEVFVETGAELRVPLGELAGLFWGTTLFVDGGDVVQQRDGLDLRNLHWAAGVGLFVKYGGFKIRVDVGQRLNRTGPLDPDYDPDGLLKNTNFFFGVGETY